jgi:hypothetical protein
MRRRELSLSSSFLVFVVACASVGTPDEYRGLTTVTTNSAYGCALAFVDSAGYILISSDRAGGFLRASRIENASLRDVIIVAVVPQAGGQTEIHVTAETFGTAPGSSQEGPITGMVNPSPAVQVTGFQLVSRCRTKSATGPADTGARTS